MPKIARELSAVELGKLPAGMHAAGSVTGLYLRVSENGARSWMLRAMVGNRRRDMGLGGWPTVSLAEARQKARETRRTIEQGTDPIAARRDAKAALHSMPTFKWCAEQTIAFKRPEWRNAKHAAQWESTLKTYAYPVLGSLPVDQIDHHPILKVLTPIWESKTETATRVRMRIEAVLAWAAVNKYRNGDNPARWRGYLDKALPAPNKISSVEHHPALAIDAMPEFIASLRQCEGMAARALEFLILTAARSGEVREAPWSEIDLEAKTWTIPAERMKGGKEHRVPLPPRAVEILRALPRVAGSEFVFPAPRGGKFSDMALAAVMKRMGTQAVPHGMRSTFRDWASERTNYPREAAEAALAHTIGNQVEAAYRRGDLFDRRRKMMGDWQRFIETKPGGKVVPLARPA